MPRPSGDSEDRRTEDEIRRALTKARKRARLENLKKLERMMGLASSSEVDYDETTKATPAPSLRTSSSTVPTTVSIIATTTTTPAPIRQRLEMDSDRILGHSKTDHSWSTFSNRNRSPGLSGATQRMSTSEASGKLNGDVKKSAEKVMQDEEGEIISEHIISAQKKEEPMNVGKQIISLDDYDDENEMIEEEYDVDEYGKRITNNQNSKYLT
ncbi:unnamed protein product [Anisakis simplex]|uniref:Uncharacterized protein n=1 Tax=Anisakis simplex TaxID=6269 RepID=A0A0M3K2Y9_ANISI|nr:unnamed protein product [Anisakis simplex]